MNDSNATMADRHQALAANMADVQNQNYYDDTLHIFPASAGSGKTWRLAFEYICLLVKEYLEEHRSDGFRHVLAITFTNKATAEMKERIVAYLEMMADTGRNDDERNRFLENVTARLRHVAGTLESDTSARAKVEEAAQKIYGSLLHDYSHFRVETIDHFFQRVFTNLTQELNINGSFTPETDQRTMMNAATHRLIADVRDQKEVKEWLTRYIRTSMDENERWNISDELSDFGGNLFNEKMIADDDMQRYLSGESGRPLKDKVEELRQRISEKEEEARKQKQETAEDLLMEMEDALSGTYKKTIDKLALDGSVLLSFDTYEKYATPIDDYKILLKKKRMPEDVAFVAEKISHILKLQTKGFTLDMLKRYLYGLGVLDDLRQRVEDIQQEQGVFMLSFTQPLLNKFLTGQEVAPFIFEKIGDSLRYLMIDEFQDTSTVQYKNFRPLIENCCASNSGSLVVGDPKQSIYRFRNGNWEIINKLEEQAENKPAGEFQIEAQPCRHRMQLNFRSLPNVVAFNNSLFCANPASGSVSVIKLLEDENPYLPVLYDQSAQIAVKEGRGFVKVLLAKKQTGNAQAEEDDDEEDTENGNWMAESTVKAVEELVRNGVREEDILILVDRNRHIPVLAQALNKARRNVVSDEAFLLKASVRVRLVMSAVRYISTQNTEKRPDLAKADLYREQFVADYFRYKNETAEKYDHQAAVAQAREMLDLIDGRKKDGSLVPETERIASMPVYDMVEQLVATLFPGLPTDAYLQCFLDEVRAYVAKYVSSISDFVQRWDISISEKSVPASIGSQKGIRIMSIHKSKGLQAHSVIVPYCNWKLLGAKSGTPFWTKIDDSKRTEMSAVLGIERDLLPPMAYIKAESKAQYSLFRAEYEEECQQMEVDNINKLYVALTRAERNLVVIGEYKDKDERAKDVGTLLYRVLQDRLTAAETEQGGEADVDAAVADDLGEMQYAVGNVEKSKETAPEPMIEPFCIQQDTFEMKGRFRQSSKAKEFVAGGIVSHRQEKINTGIAVHSVFEQILWMKTPKNAKNAVNDAVENLVGEGLVLLEGKDELESQAMDYWNKLDGRYQQDWFCGEIEVKNECEFVLMDNEKEEMATKRPDRMVYRKAEDQLIIVDYKTGNPSPKHKDQVQQYMSLAADTLQCGNVKGYLWYMPEGKVEEVTE